MKCVDAARCSGVRIHHFPFARGRKSLNVVQRKKGRRIPTVHVNSTFLLCHPNFSAAYILPCAASFHDIRLSWLPDGYSQILRLCLALRASGLWLRYAALQNLIPSFPWNAPHALYPGTIQGKEGIKFCHLATLRPSVHSLIIISHRRNGEHRRDDDNGRARPREKRGSSARDDGERNVRRSVRPLRSSHDPGC